MRSRTMGILSFLALVAGLWGCDDNSRPSSMHVEEFRVAEPLKTGGASTIQDQLETITAVTEPYDEVEAAVDDEPERLAESTLELHRQCMTVVKEMAYCTTEDSFLEIIGRAPNLRTSEEREYFMNRVEWWFEPGGAKADCDRILDNEALQKRRAKQMFQRSAEAAQVLCDEFGEVLIAVDAFAWLAPFWEDR